MTVAADVVAEGPGVRARVANRLLPRISFLLLAILVTEAILEAWLVAALPGTEPGRALKLGRNGLYVVLAGLTLAQVALARRWRDFLTPADGAFAILSGVIIIAGLAGGSSAFLTLQGAYVYLRSAVVLYALRAAMPDWSMTRQLLWVAGALLLVNVAVAVLQAVVGEAAYTGIGFSDLTWANQHRAQGMQSHPNHLGHLLALAMLGLLAWFSTIRTVGGRWWLLFTAYALALALSQSRESLLGLALGIAAIATLRRGAFRRIISAAAIVGIIVLVTWTVQPGNWASLAGRLQGVSNAIEVPSGQTPATPCDPQSQACTVAGAPKREIRVLYLQQGWALWVKSPLLGYGVGQFGGAVAAENNPEWYRNPKFGPEGFNMHGFQAKQVDSFWLHLLVEGGALAMIAYLAWLAMLALPLIRVARTNGPSPATASGFPGVGRSTALWACAAIGLTLVIGGFSPAPEDALYAPLAMGVIGVAWVNRTDKAMPTP